jgi:hypothetical protein
MGCHPMVYGLNCGMATPHWHTKLLILLDRAVDQFLYQIGVCKLFVNSSLITDKTKTKI